MSASATARRGTPGDGLEAPGFAGNLPAEIFGRGRVRALALLVFAASQRSRGFSGARGRARAARGGVRGALGSRGGRALPRRGRDRISRRADGGRHPLRDPIFRPRSARRRAARFGDDPPAAAPGRRRHGDPAEVSARGASAERLVLSGRRPLPAEGGGGRVLCGRRTAFAGLFLQLHPLGGAAARVPVGPAEAVRVADGPVRRRRVQGGGVDAPGRKAPARDLALGEERRRGARPVRRARRAALGAGCAADRPEQDRRGQRLSRRRGADAP